MRKVVVAVDWSDYAEKAFDYYIYNFHRKGYMVILAHYIDASNDKERMAKEAQMLELQEVYEGRLLQLKIDNKWVTGTTGSPGEFLVKLTKEEAADLVVMGARGMGKLKKTILGSVSDHVLSKVKCPVLICKEQHEK